MTHPFGFVSARLGKPLFLAALLWALVLFAVMQVLNQPLITSAAPAGIVSFELAGTPQRAAHILTSWAAQSTPPGTFSRPLEYAAFGLGLDYLFIPAYAIAIGLGALLAARRHAGRFAVLGAWVGWGSVLAAVFDALENLALWNLLRALPEIPSAPLWPAVALCCAVLKFLLIVVGLVYSLAGVILPVARRL